MGAGLFAAGRALLVLGALLLEDETVCPGRFAVVDGTVVPFFGAVVADPVLLGAVVADLVLLVGAVGVERAVVVSAGCAPLAAPGTPG